MKDKRTGASRQQSDLDEKRDREINDLRLVLGTLLEDRGLQRGEKQLVEYLNEEFCHVRTSFSAQRIHARDIFPLVLEPGAPVLVGGGGVVIRCANEKQPSVKYALKIPRPSLFVGKGAPANYQEAVQEYLMHAPLSHENIARVFGTGKVTIPSHDRPPSEFDAILMEWIDGAEPLNSYLANAEIDYRQVVELLIQTFKALAYLHSRHLIHWDIKSANLLVSGSGTVKLTDIGNARRDDDMNRGNIAHSTRGNPPPCDLYHIAETDEVGGTLTSRRISIHLANLACDCPWLDLWMLARELNRLFKAKPALFEEDCRKAADEEEELANRATVFLQKKFPPGDDDARFALGFLRLIIQRLLVPRGPKDFKCYEKAETVIQDLSKLLPEFGGAQSVRELQAIPQRVLRLPRSGNAPWTGRISRVFNEAFLQRLRRHKQLGAVSQVYPGASHTRLEHVAGVFATVSQFVRALYADRTDPFWRMATDYRDINALLLASLVHDVGHISFGHFIEEMHGLVEGRFHEDYAFLLLDPQHADHVRFGETNRIAANRDRELFRKVVITEWGISEKEVDSFLQYVARILRPDPAECVCTNRDSQLRPQESTQLRLEILHSIMDSAIDADKLDYLLRDSHHCGVHYADGIDVDRFFQSLTAIPFLPYSIVDQRTREEMKRQTSVAYVPRASVGVTSKGILPVESLLIARYQMFSCVYWHHTTRAQTAMLQFLVLSYLEGGQSPSDVEQRLDELIQQFREVDDEEALLWLRVRLVGEGSPAGERERLLRDVADGVLGRDRKLLYWTGFELLYEQEPRGRARRIYDGLMGLSEEAASQKSPAAYVTYCKNIRRRFSAFFVKKLHTQVEFADGEILIDIPPARKDQVDNVFVNLDVEVRQIQELSPLADAVRAAFKYWVRKPRVFFAPSAWRKCKAERLDEKEIWDACFSSLMEMVVPQTELFEQG